MKIKSMWLATLLLLLSWGIQAQEQKLLTLDEAVSTAVSKSTEATLADTKVETAALGVSNAKNNRYPDLKISGQYQHLTNPEVTFRLPLGNSGEGSGSEGENSSSPKVNRIMIGQASLGMPIFSGFKIQNSIKAVENLYTAEKFNAANTKNQVALRTIALYVNLYKAQESVILIEKSLASANQRVTDFEAMEENGLLARNDLLKAQLQASNIELSLEDAKRQVSTINYQLITLLKLPENTKIKPDDRIFKTSESITPTVTAEDAVAQRNDLEAMRWQQKAAEASIKVAKADYYPSLSFVAGYAALDVQNVFKVYNAVNIGVGLSYDVSSLFKNKDKVQAERSKAEEARQTVELLTDRVKVEVNEALENYNLAIKKRNVYIKAVEQAEENFRIVKDKYDNGLSDTNDLLEAEVQQLQARINEAFSKADITQKYYELLNTSGKLTNAFNLTQNN